MRSLVFAALVAVWVMPRLKTGPIPVQSHLLAAIGFLCGAFFAWLDLGLEGRITLDAVILPIACGMMMYAIPMSVKQNGSAAPDVREANGETTAELSGVELPRLSVGACLEGGLIGGITLAGFCLLGIGWQGPGAFGALVGASLAAALVGSMAFWAFQTLRRSVLGFVALSCATVFSALSVLEVAWSLGTGSAIGPAYVGPAFNVFIAIIWGTVFGIQGWSAQCAGQDFLDHRVKWTLSGRCGGAG